MYVVMFIIGFGTSMNRAAPPRAISSSNGTPKNALCSTAKEEDAEAAAAAEFDASETEEVGGDDDAAGKIFWVVLKELCLSGIRCGLPEPRRGDPSSLTTLPARDRERSRELNTQKKDKEEKNEQRRKKVN